MSNLAILSELLPNYTYIFGNDEGKLGTITKECLDDCRDWLCKRAPRVVRAPLACGGYFKLLIPVEPWEDQRVAFSVEETQLQKYIIGGRWVIRCVFSERANTWVVLDHPVRDLKKPYA